jgi:hypothetical protein
MLNNRKKDNESCEDHCALHMLSHLCPQVPWREVLLLLSLISLVNWLRKVLNRHPWVMAGRDMGRLMFAISGK